MGACTFIIVYIIFCQCPTRHLAQAFQPGKHNCCSRRHYFTARPDIRYGVALWRGQIEDCLGLVCVLFARLLALLCLLACVGAAALALAALLALAGLFLLFVKLAPLLVRVCAGRGQLLCPWDRGDKVVSSCWWVRACFIHPETLFQTLSQFQTQACILVASWVNIVYISLLN